MKYLYLCITLSYILGIYLSSHINSDFMCIFFVSSIISLLLTLIIHKHWQIPAIALMFTLGGVSCNYITTIENSDLYNFNTRYITATGKICEIPQKPYESENYTYIIQTDTITFDGDKYTVSDKIRISTPHEYPYGAVISASGFLNPFEPKSSIGEFNSRLYYKSKGISYKLYSPENYSRLIKSSTPPDSIYDIANRLRIAETEFINRHFTDRNIAAMLNAIIVGDDSGFTLDLQNVITTSGASRYINSPYLTIMAVSYIIGTILSVLKISRRKRDIIFIILLFLIAAANQNSPTLYKSVFIIAAYRIYTIKYGFLYIPDVLPIAILIILLGNPLFAYHAGFVLSIASTLLLYMFKEPLIAKLYFIKNRLLRNSICIWLLLGIGLMPLSAYFFNGFSPYTLFYSLIITPISLIIICVSPVLFPITEIPFIGNITEFLLSLLSYLIIAFVNFVSRFPAAHIGLASPTILEIVLYICILLVIKYIIDKDLSRITLTSLITASVVFTAFIAYDKLSSIGELNVNIVNVGQGDATVISVPFGEKVIIDGGGSADYSDYNVGDNIFVPYLEHYGIYHIDTAVVSHYHKDHAEGIVSALTSAKIDKLVLPDCMPLNPYRLQIEALAKFQGTELIYCKVNDIIEFPSGLSLHFLSPDEQLLNSDEENDTSIVVKLSYGEFDMLFTGDITSTAEAHLTEKNLLSDCDVVKLAHHGSSGSTSEEFLKLTNPEYAVISVGENNSYGHPSPDTLERLNKHGTIPLRTDELGDITLTADKSGLKNITYYKDGE